MFVWKFSEPVDRDKHSDGIFRRTLKIGRNFTQNLEKQPKNWEKNLENLESGKKYLGDTLKDFQKHLYSGGYKLFLSIFLRNLASATVYSVFYFFILFCITGFPLLKNWGKIKTPKWMTILDVLIHTFVGAQVIVLF